MRKEFIHHALHGYAVNPDTGEIAQYPELSKCSEGKLWEESNMDEWGRLMNGHDTMAKGTNTLKFIPRSAIPHNKKTTYMAVVCAF